MKAQSIRAVVLAWTAAWSIASVIAGTLTSNADVPHLPRAFGPIVFAGTGALAGLCASLIFLLLRRLLRGAAPPAMWRTVVIAAAAGALTMLILAPVIGVPPLAACIAGIATGALSGFFTADRAAEPAPSR